jgi:hypothetical protein
MIVVVLGPADLVEVLIVDMLGVIGGDINTMQVVHQFIFTFQIIVVMQMLDSKDIGLMVLGLVNGGDGLLVGEIREVMEYIPMLELVILVMLGLMQT